VAEAEKIRTPHFTSETAPDYAGKKGMVLPAVQVAQLAKFHSKAKKGNEEGIDLHAQASKAFELTTQRKTNNTPENTAREPVQPFKPLE
jgi:hypothetical protein